MEQKIDKKKYDKFFHHGIVDKEELLEGIIYFSYFKDTWRKLILNTQENTGEQIREDTIKSATDKYIQFYRFVELNDKPQIYNCFKFENRKEIEDKIRTKIDTLAETKENIPEEKIKQEIENEIRKIKRYKRENISEEEKIQIEKEVREKAKKITKLTKTKDGIAYSRRQLFRFAHYPEGSFGPEQTEIIRHWTEEMYDILEILGEIEKQEPYTYIKLWIKTRMQRIKNNTIEGIEEIEKKRIESAYTKIEKEKENNSQIGIGER